MKLEIGMYLRFNGMINKILELEEDYIVFDQNFYDSWLDEVSAMYIKDFLKEYENDIKASHNIINLIEVGDYVNGMKVLRAANCITVMLENEENIWWVKPDEIKSIVTKEQFESISYKVGD